MCFMRSPPVWRRATSTYIVGIKFDSSRDEIELRSHEEHDRSLIYLPKFSTTFGKCNCTPIYDFLHYENLFTYVNAIHI